MSVELPPKPSRRSKALAAMACALAVLGLVFPAPGFLELYRIPAGTACRPMGQVASIFLAGLGTPLLVLPFAIMAISEHVASRVMGLLAMTISVLPLPLYSFLFRWIMDTHALVPQP